jgi:hypothetical protein
MRLRFKRGARFLAIRFPICHPPLPDSVVGSLEDATRHTEPQLIFGTEKRRWTLVTKPNGRVEEIKTSLPCSRFVVRPITGGQSFHGCRLYALEICTLRLGAVPMMASCLPSLDTQRSGPRLIIVWQIRARPILPQFSCCDGSGARPLRSECCRTPRLTRSCQYSGGRFVAFLGRPRRRFFIAADHAAILQRHPSPLR